MTKLALGTAQFGLSYGITNASGQVPENMARSILASAATNGVEVIDTAAAYGDAECVLGRILPTRNAFKIISKTLPLRVSRLDQASIDKVMDGISASLHALRRTCIDGLLVHHAQDLMAAGGDRLFAMLQTEQSRGRIGKIGVSVYDGTQLDALIPRFPIQIVQLPLNVLDQRLIQSGWIRRLSDMGIEVHVRSAFLQGVLLNDADTLPDRLGNVKAGANRFQQRCAALGIHRATACLSFLKSIAGVSQVVCGVVDRSQFDEICLAWAQSYAQDTTPFTQFAMPDQPLLNPVNWGA